MRTPPCIDYVHDPVPVAPTAEAMFPSDRREPTNHEVAGNVGRAQPAGMTPGQYRPEIDGLRAVAVLAVLFFHAGGLVPGGYAGVDVFFVISGFLITSLIRKELEAGTFRLSSFWERRICRIFPAQVVLVGVVLVFGMLLLLPRDFWDLCKSALAQSVFLSNVYWKRHLGYFDGPAEIKPLLHMWSLAVEEQFYVGFPLFLVAFGGLRRSALGAIIAILALLSFVLSVWGVRAYPSATFFLLPARTWELLVGSLLTFLPRTMQARRTATWLREAGSAVGLLCVVGAFALFDRATLFPGATAVLPCSGAALIIHSNRFQRTWVGRLLAARPIVFVGLISYSLYLWHWPALAFCRYLNNDSLDVWPCVLAVAGSFVAAFLSWKYVETPFRRRPGRGRVVSAALFSSTVIVAVAIVGWQTQGLPQRFSTETLALFQTDRLPLRFETVQAADVAAGRLPTLGRSPLREARRCFLLWGDSHAMVVGETVSRLAEAYGVGGYAATRLGTLPVLGIWRPAEDKSAVAWNRAVLDFVKARKIRDVILVSRWSINIEGRPNGSMDSLVIDEISRGTTKAEAKWAFKRGIERTIEELRAAGIRVWILKQVPEQRGDPTRALGLARFLPWRSSPSGVSLSDHRSGQANVDEILGNLDAADIHICDPTDACFDASGTSLISGNGRPYYLDDNHLSTHGADALLGGLFDKCLSEIAADYGAAQRDDQ